MNACQENIFYAFFCRKISIHGVFAQHEHLRNKNLSSGKFLSTKTCYPESFCFFWPCPGGLDAWRSDDEDDKKDNENNDNNNNNQSTNNYKDQKNGKNNLVSIFFYLLIVPISAQPDILKALLYAGCYKIEKNLNP